MSLIDRREEKIAEALAQGHEIVTANDKLLILDFDDVDECPNLQEKFKIINELNRIQSISRWRSKSGTGWHMTIELLRPLTFFQRIALEAALGSDWKRAMLYALKDFDGNEPFLIRPGLKRIVELARGNKW